MKKIKVGVVGVGYLGRLHAQKYAMIEEAELVGVTDVDFDRAKEIAESVNTKAFPSYKDLIGKVDAVSIVTPTESHCRIGVEFLSKGIDVLVEKPIAVNTAEAEELIREAGKTKAILQVGHLERFNAAIVALGGRVTNPLFIESDRLSPFPNRSTDVDVILDLMIHDIDIILNLVNSEVESVEAVGLPVISGKMDVANARLKFRNGCIANVTASRASKDRVRKIRIFETNGYTTIDFANQHISVSKAVPGKDGGYPSLQDEELDIEKRDSLLEELKSFVSCSATRKKPLVSGHDGKRALEVAQMVQEAARISMANFR